MKARALVDMLLKLHPDTELEVAKNTKGVGIGAVTDGDVIVYLAFEYVSSSPGDNPDIQQA